MMEQYRTLGEFLMEYLSDPENTASYFQVTFEEYLGDGDKDLFREGLTNIINAQGGIISTSKQIGIDSKLLSDVIYEGIMPHFNVIEDLFKFFRIADFSNLVPAGVRSQGVFLRDVQPNMVENFIQEESEVAMSPQPYAQKMHVEYSSGRSLKRIRYWESLFELMELSNSSFQHPIPNESHYRDLKIGIPGCVFRARQSVRPKEISAAFIVRGVNSIRRFYSLRTQQTEIEKEFDDELEWDSSIKVEKRVVCKNKDADPDNENDWHNQHQWLVNTLEKLYNVFKPRIEQLPKIV